MAGDEARRLEVTRTARRGSANAYFGAFVFMLLVVLVLVVDAVGAPATQAFDCRRASGHCSLSRQWWVGEARPFAVTDLSDVGLVGDPRHPAIGSIGRGEMWTPEATDDDAAAVYREAVAALHAFGSGTDASLHVEIPNSHRRSITMVLLGILVIGVPFFLRPAARSDRSSSLVLDRDAGLATIRRRGFFGARRERTVPIPEITAVRMVGAARRGGAWASLHLEPGGAVVHREPTSRDARKALAAEADRIAAFLGVPHEAR